MEAIGAYEQAVSLGPDNEQYVARLTALRTVPVVMAEPDRQGKEVQVAEGQDGWLFHKIDGVFEQVCAGKGLSERNQSRLLSLWEARQAWCEARGIEYRIPDRAGEARVVFG